MRLSAPAQRDRGPKREMVRVFTENLRCRIWRQMMLNGPSIGPPYGHAMMRQIGLAGVTRQVDAYHRQQMAARSRRDDPRVLCVSAEYLWDVTYVARWAGLRLRCLFDKRRDRHPSRAQRRLASRQGVNSATERKQLDREQLPFRQSGDVAVPAHKDATEASLFPHQFQTNSAADATR